MAPFAQVLAELGSFGHFHVQLLILLSVPSFLTAFYMFTQVFMVLDEAHYCSVACFRIPITLQKVPSGHLYYLFRDQKILF